MDGSAAFDLEKHDIIKLRTFVAGLKPLLAQRWYSESTEPKHADTTGITEKNKTRKTADLVWLAAGGFYPLHRRILPLLPGREVMMYL